MYGVVTRDATAVSWPDFDRAFYEVKAPSGRHTDPVPAATSLVSCFGDTATAEATPELAAVDDAGRQATRAHPDLEAGYVCPVDEHYREGLLETVSGVAAVSGDVRLDHVGFPGEAFCHCERCEATVETGDDRLERRADVVTGFVERASDRVEGRCTVSLPPDPYPGHLRSRWGIDVEAIEPHVDEVVVPLYDPGYETTYWVETIARGFADRLEVPLGVELYAAGVEVGSLVRATEAVAPHVDGVYFGYDAGTARGVLRRLRAEQNEGETHGP